MNTLLCQRDGEREERERERERERENKRVEEGERDSGGGI